MTSERCPATFVGKRCQLAKGHGDMWFVDLSVSHYHDPRAEYELPEHHAVWSNPFELEDR